MSYQKLLDILPHFTLDYFTLHASDTINGVTEWCISPDTFCVLNNPPKLCLNRTPEKRAMVKAKDNQLFVTFENNLITTKNENVRFPKPFYLDIEMFLGYHEAMNENTSSKTRPMKRWRMNEK